MGNAQSYAAASLAACSAYFVYVHIYCSHKLLKTNILTGDRLPSIWYLLLQYVARALMRRPGVLHTTPPQKKNDTAYTVLRCRLDKATLRSFCNAGGYGWDYPDSEYRDIPLCFPEFLCSRLLLMVITDDSFRLSPAGLVRVCQSLKTLQPIDELKKGPFILQARVLVYRKTDAGVEVDICLSATCRSGNPVWESVLTLLSKHKLHTANRCLIQAGNESELCEPVPDNIKQVELRVPWMNKLMCAWSSVDCSLYQLLSLPARLCGCRSQTTPGPWMLSVCLAEIEKHKGVEVITAPISITAQFEEPLVASSKVMVRFWETAKTESQSSAQGLSFLMQQYGSNITHMGPECAL